jgi:hypothetical protein
MASTVQPTDRDERRGGVSRTVLTLGIVVALAVGGLIGVAIGWKVEQKRVKDDVQNVRPVGKVTAVDGNSLTIALQTSTGTRTYAITGATPVDSARKGGTGDVAKGSTVLVKSFHNDKGQLQASEIVVLPDSSKLGSR